MKRFTLIQGGNEQPTLRNPTAGDERVTWRAMCRLRGQLDGIKASWTEDTQPIEKTWYIVWSHQLDEAMKLFLNDYPHLKASGGES